MLKSILKSAILILFVFFQISCATSRGDLVLYKSALNNAKEERLDFAFLDLKELISTYPNSIYLQNATISLGEYYFISGNYRDATEILLKYIENFPNDKNIIIAEVFLYKILTNEDVANDEKYSSLNDKLRKHFFSKSLFLIFSSSKTRSFISALNNLYRIQEYIDRIDIFKNDELFLRVLP